MRWAPIHPRQALAALLAALALAVTTLLATAPDLSTWDFSLGGSGDGATAPALRAPEPAWADRPAWLRDPLAPPVEALRP